MEIITKDELILMLDHLKCRNLRMEIITEDKLIPEALFKRLVAAMYQLSDCNVPLSEGMKVGRIIVENYWKEKSTDKSGG